MDQFEQVNNDPWGDAEHAQERVYTNIIWGQVEAQSWYCVLEKGYGKLPYDASVHNANKRFTAVDLLVRPLTEMGLPFNLSRSLVAESHEWAGVILPSIRELGIQPRDLNGKWVKVQRIPLTDRLGNPQTYTAKDGEIKESLTIKFLAFFPDENACRSDYAASQNGSAPAPADTQHIGGNDSRSKERETALKFLRVFVESACRGQSSLDVVRQTLAANLPLQPLVGKHFTVDSPETVALIAEFLK